jgi:Ca-activated chloride channel family protein
MRANLAAATRLRLIYELIPPGLEIPSDNTGVDSLRYQVSLSAVTTTQKEKFSGEVMNIKLRYKQPDSDLSNLISQPVKDKSVAIDVASVNFRFAAAVASFGMLLRNSKYKGDVTYGYVRSLASGAKGNDLEGYRREFLELVETASKITKRKEMAARNDENE